ncbi:MAG: BREX-1 system adenine-specific DNA-methyltransferase PglX [Candidatus Thorarchaeota archaeon]
MDKTLRDKIKSMVLKIKLVLEEEITRIFESKYGFYKDGTIIDITKLTKLTTEDILKRKEIELNYEYYEGIEIKKQDIFTKIVRNNAYTILNRFAALRFMDENNIIQESVTKGTNSKAFNLFKKTCPQLSIDDETYLLFLNLLYDDLRLELPLLFNRFNKESLVSIPINIIEEIINSFNNEDLIEIWKQVETIGWIYQYFFVNEKEQIRKSKSPSDLPKDSHQLIAINQFYTPNYVVRFLVDNTLGRIWKDMYPESNVEDYCKYLIYESSLEPTEITRKDVLDLKLIDPACGSGHFLLYSFDVLNYLYKEAIDNHWTDSKKIKLSEIPALIIKNNIYGIDIDDRAIQLSNLSLFLKMKLINKNLKYPVANILSANVILTNNTEKEKLKKELGNDLYINKFIDDFWNFLNHSDELGSILKIKDVIKRFISEMISSKSDIKLDDFIYNKKNKHTKSYWKDFYFDLINKIRKISQFQIYNKEDILKDQFSKSMDFLDLLLNNYDVVLMNPPYGYATEIGKNYIKNNYPSSNYNLFCAFIENWFYHLSNSGLLGAIVDNTFVVKSSYENFRKEVILKNSNLFLAADLGWNVLDNAQVATISLCLRKNSPNISIFLKLIDEDDKEQKLKEIIKKNTIPKNDQLVYIRNTNAFAKFPNNSISYSIPGSIIDLFLDYPEIDPKFVKTGGGLESGNAKRFQRYHWEIKKENIGQNKKWVPFANGGQYSPYFRPILEIIKWENSGYEIKNHYFPKGHKNEGKRRSSIRNKKYYFKEGLTWGKRGKYINISHLPRGCIFSKEGQLMYPKNKEDTWYIMGLVNSKLIQYTLNTYCGQHKQCGYVALLPFNNTPDNLRKEQISEKSEKIFIVKKKWYKGDQLSPNFLSHWLILQKSGSFNDTIQQVLDGLDEFESETTKLQDEIDHISFELYGINDKDKEIIISELEDRPNTVVWDDMRNKEDKEKRKELIKSFLTYTIGVSLNHWVNPNFQLSDNKGVIVDDPGSKLDIKNLNKKFLEKTFNDSSDIISKIEVIINKNLRTFLQSDLFEYHYKKYKKCPIFWQLTIPSKTYSIWINYLFLSKEYLLKIKNEILESKMQFEEEKLDTLSEELRFAEIDNEKSLAKRLSKEISQKQKLLEELKEFYKNFIEIIDLSLPFDLDDGVAVNIAPFYKLVPWNDPKNNWDKIIKGEFEWSTLSKHLKKRGKI